MDRDAFIFRDPLGRRWRRVGRLALVAGALLLLAGGLFVGALLTQPRLLPLGPTAAQGPAEQPAGEEPRVRSVARHGSRCTWILIY